MNAKKKKTFLWHLLISVCILNLHHKYTHARCCLHMLNNPFTKCNFSHLIVINDHLWSLLYIDWVHSWCSFYYFVVVYFCCCCRCKPEYMRIQNELKIFKKKNYFHTTQQINRWTSKCLTSFCNFSFFFKNLFRIVFILVV